MPFECITIPSINSSQDSEFAKMNIVNIKNYGAVGDGIADDTSAIVNAITASANKTLYFPSGTYLITNNITVGSNVQVEFANGAKIKCAFGKTFTINGKLTAGLYQIFENVNGCPNGTFDSSDGWTVGSGWSISGGVATHTTGNTGTLSYASCVGVSGKTFIVKYTVGGNPNGGVIPSIGGVSGYRRSTAGTYVDLITATGSGALTFTPETNFGGTLDNVEVYMLHNYVLGTGSVEQVLPQWWGAIGDDSTDCYVAFEQAVTCASYYNGTVYVPAGTYRVSSMIRNFRGTYNGTPAYAMVFKGAGSTNTIIKYTGADDGCAIGVCVDRSYPYNYGGSISWKLPSYMTLSDFQVQAPDVTDEGAGIRACSSRTRYERITARYIPNGSAFRVSRSRVVYYNTGRANDTDVEITSSGSGNAEKLAMKCSIPSGSAFVRKITVRMKRLGNPSGTVYASIYTDNSGVPGTLMQFSSNGIACNTLPTGSDGGEVEFKLYQTSPAPLPIIETGYNYWIVLSTSGYTNDANNKIYVRAKSNDTTSGFAVYDYTTSTWSSNNNGSDWVLNVAIGQGTLPIFTCIQTSKHSSSGMKYGFYIEHDAQAMITESNIFGYQGIVSRGDTLIYVIGTDITNEANQGPVIDIKGECKSYWQSSYIETPNNVVLDGGRHRFNQIQGAHYLTWTLGTQVRIGRSCGVQFPIANDPSMKLECDYVVIPGDNNYELHEGAIVESDTDGDALGPYRFKLDPTLSGVYVGFGGRTPERLRQFLPRGTYLVTVYGKQTGTVTNNIAIITGSYGVKTLRQYYTFTNEYKPYHMLMYVDPDYITTNSRYFKVYKKAAATNTIYVSHFEFRYLGPDKASQQTLVANNTDASDNDSARDSKVLFIGKRTPSNSSDNEIVSALAHIKAMHDGNERDEKGKLEIAVNVGTDKFAPSKTMIFNSSGDLIANNHYITGRATITGNSYRLIQEALHIMSSPRLALAWVSNDMITEPDLSGNSNNGTYYGNPPASSISVKHSIWTFKPNGTTNRLEIPDADTLSFGNGSSDSPVSILAWANIVERGVSPVIIGKWDSTSGAQMREWQMYMGTDETFTYMMYDESVDANIGKKTSSPLSIDTWHFLVATYDGSGNVNGIKLYVDGVQASTTNLTSGTYTAMENLTNAVQVACQKTGASSYANWWNTYMGPILIEGSELSSKAIWELYLLGKSYLGI